MNRTRPTDGPLYLKTVAEHDIYVTEAGAFQATIAGKTVTAPTLVRLEKRIHALPQGRPVLLVTEAIATPRPITLFGARTFGRHHILQWITSEGILNAADVARMTYRDEAVLARLRDIARRHADCEMEWRGEVAALPDAEVPMPKPKQKRPSTRRLRVVEPEAQP